MAKSANIFGSFLDSVKESSVSTAFQGTDDFSAAVNFALKPRFSSEPPARPLSQPGGGDVIPTILRAIGKGALADIVAIVNATGLSLDAVAAGLQAAVKTGLLRPQPKADGSVDYALTPVGEKMV